MKYYRLFSSYPVVIDKSEGKEHCSDLSTIILRRRLELACISAPVFGTHGSDVVVGGDTLLRCGMWGD
jgi:hypothetical protein